MDPPTTVNPPKVTLTFKEPEVRRSKMLVSTNRNADGTYKPQTYTNTLLNNGTPVTAGAAYSITDKPAGLTGQITVNEATGEVTFGEAALDKVNADGPQTVTVQAAYQGGTASYAFTVTDHFSPRDLHASVVLDGALYVIAGGAGIFGDTALDDVWRSTDRGVSWSRVTPAGASVPFPMDYRFASAVLGSTMYVLGGIRSTPFTRLDEVWKSADRGASWTQATNATDPKFPARSQNAAVVLGNAGAARLYVIGGYGSSSNDLDDVWESGDGASWIQVNASAAARDKFPARNSHSAVAVGDTVYPESVQKNLKVEYPSALTISSV